MTWLRTMPILAELSAELISWIVIGAVWAIAQVLAKKNKDRNEAQPLEEPRAAQRTTATPRPPITTDPVSPNDELRNFLRKISGENVGEDEVKTAPEPRPQAQLRSAPDRKAPQRSEQMHSVAESRRHSRPSPPPLQSAPQPPPAMPRQQRPATGYGRLTSPIMTAAGKKRQTTLKPPALLKTRPTAKRKAADLINWRAAVLHREILGPPSAVRPYSPNEL